MERRAKVELFGQIRKEYEFGVGTIGSGAQARGASADGAPGAGQRRATGPQAESTRAAGDRAAAALHRHHPGGRSQRAAQAAPHCTSDLRADQERATGVPGSRGDGAAVRARAQRAAGLVNAHNLRAAELRARSGGPGRLVRGVGGAERCAGKAAGVLAAQHGERRRVSSGLSSRHPAGLSRGLRASLSLFWRGLSAVQV